MHIRIATSSDREAVRSVHWSAFAEDEREIVSDLAVDLMSEETTPRTFSLVAETEGVLVGHVAFSPVTFAGNADFQGYIMAPLGISPAYQKRGIGTRLVEDGIGQLSEMGVGILFVYGDPKYYCRFGFSVDAAEGYVPPYKLQYPFGWQGLVLNDGSAGAPPVTMTCVTSLCDPALW